MNMKYYVWNNNTVKVYQHYSDVERLQHCWVFDPVEIPDSQWAIMYKRRWMTMPKEEVPKAFLATLLLMGIPT